MSKFAFREKIIEICKLLHSKNMLAAADGNVSFRQSDDEIHITPAGRPKAFIDTNDMAMITLKNEILEGTPSSERLMHLEVYRKCPQAKCVIHAHPPTAIAWSIAFPDLKTLPSEAISEVILATGQIPFVPFALPGTLEMGTNLHLFLPKHRVMILARHGALSWGESLEEAYNGMERLEHAAIVLKTAIELGGVTSLSPEHVDKLYEMRKKLGDKTL